MSRIHYTARTLALILTSAAVLGLPGTAKAIAEAPIKEVLSNHIGFEVNQSTKANSCTVESKDTCQYAKPSVEPGGFNGLYGVAANDDPASPEHNDVYVADQKNSRVQVLTPAGQFVSMFGWDVNRTKEMEPTAVQAEKNVCTAISKDVCQAGVKGEAPGQFSGGFAGIAVNPTSGDVYTAEVIDGRNGAGELTVGDRVQTFTAEGGFVLEIGKEVNETTKGNLCMEEEVEKEDVKCKGPAQREATAPYEWGSEHGAFNFADNGPSVLTVGGPGDLLYVGDEQRVQEFEADGKYKNQILSPSSTSEVSGITVDNSCSLHDPILTENTTPTCKEFDPFYGNVYLVLSLPGDNPGNVIYQFNQAGGGVKEFELPDREPKAEPIETKALAVDSAGRLVVSEREAYNVDEKNLDTFRGSLYQVGSANLRLLIGFTNEFPKAGSGVIGSAVLAFSGDDELYAVTDQNELVSYVPLPVGELSTSPVVCKAGAGDETDATVDCSLGGEVNPWGVSGTKVSFQWGSTSVLGTETPEQAVSATSSTPVRVNASLEGLLPNETYYERLVGYDDNVRPPESALTSERTSFTTPAVAASIVGSPSVLFAGPSSAVLFGELNPENADTGYEFQYGACESLESCPGEMVSRVARSGLYGVTGTTVEVTGLQPGTVYRYRLLAEDENRTGTEKYVSKGPEGSFTTASAPEPEALTGPASEVGSTSAVVSGMVNPDGPQTTYSFELGVYEGLGTRYGVAFSGSVAAGMVFAPESFSLTGLQPGTTYAYRIVIKSGYIDSNGGVVEGQPVTFTTTGLPGVLDIPTPLSQLALPSIAFPKTASTAKAKKKTKPKPKKRRKARAKRAKPHKSKPTIGRKP